MSENNDIATIPTETAMVVYTSPNGLDPYIAKIREEIDLFIPDVSTKKGRDAIASIAHKVAKSKVYLDNCGKELVAELKQKPALIDAERKRMRDTLDAWKDEVRRPLTDWENAEAERTRSHLQRISNISAFAQCEDLSAIAACSAAFSAAILSRSACTALASLATASAASR